MELYVTLPCIGIIVTGFYFLSLCKLLFKNLISPYAFSKRHHIRKFGNWIVITGASDGIGKAFAELLAKEKYNLVLISRSYDKLEQVKSDILSKYKVEIKLISADFTKVDIYNKIENELKNLDIGLLINNVGMSLSYPDYLNSDTNTNESLINLINCNCISTILMTKLVLKLRMMEKGGFILNISSASSKFPIPLLSVYGASKSFVNAFCVNMESELQHSKVQFQTVAPFFVSTKMSKLRPSLMIPTPRSYANSVLNRLGTCSFTYGCFIHELQGWFIGLLPDFLISRMVFKTNFDVRRRALAKAAKIN